MKTVILFAAGLVVAGLAGCTSEAPVDISDTPPKPEIIAPVLGVMHSPQSDAFCNFFPEGHTFVFGDPDTWKFVFTSPLDNSVGDGMAMIDGKIRGFRNVSGRKTSGGEVKHFRTLTAPFVEIEVAMTKDKTPPTEGEYSESTGYTGTVRVIAPATGKLMRFYGDCGV